MERKKILVLGAGMVARPCVEYLTRNGNNELTIACRNLGTAHALAAHLPRTSAIALDVALNAELQAHVAVSDVVISLVPFKYHLAVVEAAIKSGTNVATTSYVSPALRQLEPQIKEAGIVVINEVGVDPGIDHLFAIKTIAEVHAKGGKVKEFYSYCGGLPAPECADNPLGFKFSWSPRGALLSQTNSASFFQNGDFVSISADDLMSTAKPYFVSEGYDFVAYANRDSTPFRDFYRIPEAHTIIRGSLRYAGNPAFVEALDRLGWLDATHKDWLRPGMTWLDVQQKMYNSTDASALSVIAHINEICKFPTDKESQRIVSGMRELGLLTAEQVSIKDGNLLDTLCEQLEKLLSFKPGERDLVMLQHKFVVEWADGKQQTLTSTLELFGDPKGFSGMAKSVGVTCGIATQLLLDGHPLFSKPGIFTPYTEETCAVLRELVEREGIKMVEEVVA